MNITELYKGRFTISYKDATKALSGRINQYHITDKLTSEEITLELSNADNLTEESIYNILKETIDNMISNHRNNKIDSIIN